jgi:phosphoribosylamine--glycine ligase
LRVLLVGGGGREHALAWRIAESPRVSALLATPGNPGIARHARCLEVAADDLDGLLQAAGRERVDLTVVGPEAPLVAGLADRFHAKGHVVLGPTAAAAAIEGSKTFAKTLMARHGIPTARFQTFDDAGAARGFCRELGAPLVVKADGLAAGKGAIVCGSLDEADAALGRCLEQREFGASGARVVVEEFLRGREISFFALVNGAEAVPLGAAEDHKAVFDGDLGPNTGGMGAFSPVPALDDALQSRIMAAIVAPTVKALAAEGAPYRGVLFVQLMLTDDGPRVVEFNCRFGDPECQAILALADGDLVPLLRAAAHGEPLAAPAPPRAGAAVCVNIASGGYPGRYTTGYEITGLEAAESVPGVRVFHAGTARRDGRLVTAGGRVLGVTAVGADVAGAIQAAYDAVGKIHFEGMHYRTDIGRRPGR